MLQLLLDLFGDARAEQAQVPGTPPPVAEDLRQKTAPALDLPAQEAIESVAIEPTIALGGALQPAQFSHPRANREIQFANVRVAYEFRRSQRRSIGFQVGPDGLRVSAPRWAALRDVDAALRGKERWIVAKLREARERQVRLAAAQIDWREGAEVPFLGEPVVLVIDPRQRHGRGGAVLVTGDAALPGVPAMALHIGLPQTATPEQLRDTVHAWLMRQARRLFTERLDHFAPQLGVHWQKLSLSSAGTRWGSASVDGSIRLNWRLIHFRLPMIDYVVVHELAHLREMNHSPRFWQHVEDILPDYAERRDTLQNQPVPHW